MYICTVVFWSPGPASSNPDLEGLTSSGIRPKGERSDSEPVPRDSDRFPGTLYDPLRRAFWGGDVEGESVAPRLFYAELTIHWLGITIHMLESPAGAFLSALWCTHADLMSTPQMWGAHSYFVFFGLV